ncbi:MAG: hypothetical protein M3495_20875 [Pseudomonadota bacterium]|nr:hypothetical protein [Gammaproteobacteria bacterium]MDQ3583893.1 hypothetical protein [Pseudomonadota bacterium]
MPTSHRSRRKRRKRWHGDLPVVVEFVVSDAEAARLIELVGAERASLFYVRIPVELGVTRNGG